MAEKRVRVRILPRRSVVVDGRQETEGALVHVPVTEAATLIEEGFAQDAAEEPRRHRHRTTHVAGKSPNSVRTRRRLRAEQLGTAQEERG